MRGEVVAANAIHIDTSLIPDHVRDVLATSAMDMVLDIIRKPGGWELLDAKKAEIARRKTVWPSDTEAKRLQ